LKIKEINQENPENHFNLGIKWIGKATPEKTDLWL
jgi:hypothetical protein